MFMYIYVINKSQIYISMYNINPIWPNEDQVMGV